MGTGRGGNQVYVTDMGLATERREIQIKIDSAGGSKRNLIGTAHFASINGHLGICECPSLMFSAQILNTILVQDRCCDLESLGYMLLYFLRASLPWHGLTAKDQAQKDDLVLQKKKTVNTNLSNVSTHPL